MIGIWATRGECLLRCQARRLRFGPENAGEPSLARECCASGYRRSPRPAVRSFARTIGIRLIIVSTSVPLSAQPHVVTILPQRATRAASTDVMTMDGPKVVHARLKAAGPDCCRATDAVVRVSAIAPSPRIVVDRSECGLGDRRGRRAGSESGNPARSRTQGAGNALGSFRQDL